MRLGPYELDRQIGAGGMGEVWIAHRDDTGGARRTVAIKRLPRALADDPSYREILIQEARLSRLLRHPNIVHTYEAGEAGGEVFIAMELIDGFDLSRVTKLLALHEERLPIGVAAYIVAEILRGLAYAHALDVGPDGAPISLVHRDVSPHNVMLSTIGEVKLADFGVARLSTEETSGTEIKGKARYMPPEQLRSSSRSPAIDLFAIGAVLQELLDGAVFRSSANDDARLLGMAIDGWVPPLKYPEQVPVELEILRSRLLSSDPKRRPRSAERALELLMRWPGYQPRAAEVAMIVERVRGLEGELVSAATQTGLRRPPAMSGIEEIRMEGSELADLASMFEAPDRALHKVDSKPQIDDMDAWFPAMSSDPAPAPAPAHAPRKRQARDELETLESFDDLDDLDDLEATLPERPRSRPAPASGRPRALKSQPLAAASRSGPAIDRTAVDEAAAELDDPGLQVDLGDEELAPRRSPPARPTTGPTAVVVAPRKAVWPIVLGAVVVIAGAFGAVHALGLWPTDDPRADAPAIARRPARIVGRGSLLDLALRDHGMDRLLIDDIQFDYQVRPELDPLAALAKGEAEFAVTSLEAFVRADGPGTIVAALGSPLASEALVGRKSLAELDLGGTAIACTSSSAAFVQALDEALAASLTVALRPTDEDILAALERDDGTVTVGVLGEPWLSRARDAGMTVIASGLDLPRAHAEVLVARREIVRDDPALVEAVVGQYYATVEALEREPSKVLEQLAARGFSPEAGPAALASTCRFDGPGAAAFLADPALASLAQAGDARVDARWIPTTPASAPPNGSSPGLPACLAAHTVAGKPSQALGPLTELDASPFVAGEAALSSAGTEQVAALVARLRAFNPKTIAVEVVGWGDAPGAPGRKLGRARADALVAALGEAGVELTLRATGLEAGEDAPTSRVRLVLSRVP